MNTVNYHPDPEIVEIYEKNGLAGCDYTGEGQSNSIGGWVNQRKHYLINYEAIQYHYTKMGADAKKTALWVLAQLDEILGTER